MYMFNRPPSSLYKPTHLHLSVNGDGSKTAKIIKKDDITHHHIA